MHFPGHETPNVCFCISYLLTQLLLFNNQPQNLISSMLLVHASGSQVGGSADLTQAHMPIWRSPVVLTVQLGRLGSCLCVLYSNRLSRACFHCSYGRCKNAGREMQVAVFKSMTALCSIHLLFGRKFMTNLDSILKSRDITLPTEVRLVKAMVFQWSCMDVRVGLWRRLSAEELMLLNCGVGEDSWESLELQGDPTSPS